MISKNIVGIVLLVVLLSYLGIAFLGISISAILAGIIFFIVSFLLLNYTFLNRKNSFKDNIFIFFEVLLLCLALSLLLSAYKNFHNNSDDFNTEIAKTEADIQYLSELNDYYFDQMNYFNEEISAYEDNNLELESAIEKEQSRLDALMQIQKSKKQELDSQEIVVEEQPLIEEKYYYDDYEYEDDD